MSVKFFKKSVFAVFIAAMLLVSISSAAFASGVDNQKSVTVASYIQYLENFSVEDAQLSGVADLELAQEASENAQSQLDKFLSLTSEEQQTFIEIINNPAILENIYSQNVDDLGDYAKYVTYDSTTTEEVLPQQRAAAVSVMTITHEGVMKLFGLDLVKYRVTGKYSYDSSGVIEDLSTGGAVVQNYNPTVDTNLTWYDGYVSNNKYYGDVIFSYKIGVQGVGGVQLGNVYLGVVGDKNGKTGGYFYTE
ncbi:hypothetical protein [Paenibacillus medicaginis]|uniref:Uncharacterized protein n=1 Tax=Paenibacillus medicaginis TaxID=1470560 RepID=A0ABV5C8I5_9BACL